MKTLLRIDTSSRVLGSHTRELGDHFEKYWKSANPDHRVVYRDLASSVIPHIHQDTIEGFYTPQDQLNDRLLTATKLSDELIAELKSADDLLITSPLYNLNVPSNLKAYFDQITRVGHTFSVSDLGYLSMLPDKNAYVITAKGGSYLGTEMEKYDFQVPYLSAILRHIGISVDHFFNLEGSSDPDLVDLNKNEIKNSIESIFYQETKQI